MVYVGLACSFHDPAVAIVDDNGKVLFAQATEREVQDKRAFNVPPDRFNSIHKTIREYVDESEEELVVSTTWSNPFSPTELIWLVRGHMSNLNGLRWLVGTHNRAVRAAGLNLKFISRSELVQNRSSAWKVTRESHVHHLTHAATAAFTSPFSNAACAIIDGAGQGTSTSFFSYKEPNELRKIRAPGSVASLGLFYSLICEWCGFDSFQGEEWKVMGLAAYGELDLSIKKDLERLISVDGLRLIYPSRRREFRTIVEDYSRKRRRPDQDPIEFANLARTGQEVFVEVAIKLLCNLYDRYPSKNLVVGGGCFLNSALNGLISEQTPFDNIHVFSAPADDGNALGAALLSASARGSKLEGLQRPLSPYLGSRPQMKSLRRIVSEGAIPHSVSLDDVPLQVARLLSRGLIVGWMRGRAEFGPRALGARSILADPRSKRLADKINDTVKFREAFRPLAPSILEGYENKYFSRGELSLYMERALKFTEEGAKRTPGVVHRDGTGRFQSVSKQWNPDYFATIEEFYKITGVPILVNTSLNVMGKPIVHSVEDAINVFIGSGLDALVVENVLFAKSSATIALAAADL